jgi:TP901 family phage tail tape measure protein
MTRDIPKDATDLSDGLYQVLSAAIDADDAMGVLEDAAKGASAGMTSTYTSVDALTTILNAYQMQASESGHVTDILFKTVERGKVTYEQLASTIGMVISTAATAKVPFEEVAGAIATMTRNGLSAEVSSTSLAYAIRSIVAPTDKSIQTAERLGVSMGEAALAEKGLVGMMKEMYEATNGSQAELSRLFGSIEGGRAAVILGRNAARDYAEDVRLVGDSAGATDKAFNKLMTTNSAQMKLFKNEWEITIRSWAKEVLPTFTSLATGLKGVVQAFSALPSGVKQLIIIFGALLAVVGPISFAIGSLAAVLSGPVGLVVAVAAGVAALGLLIKGVHDAFDETKQLEGAISKVNKQLDLYKQMASEYGTQASELNKLTQEYDKLAKSTDKSKESQEKMAEVVKRIGELAPEAVTGWSRMGEATKINVKTAKESIISMLNLQKAYMQAQIEADMERKKLISQQRANIQKDNAEAIAAAKEAQGNYRNASSVYVALNAQWKRYQTETAKAEDAVTKKYGPDPSKVSAADRKKADKMIAKAQDEVLKDILAIPGIGKVDDDLVKAIKNLLNPKPGASVGAMRRGVTGDIRMLLESLGVSLPKMSADKLKMDADLQQIKTDLAAKEADLKGIEVETAGIVAQINTVDKYIKQVQAKGNFQEVTEPPKATPPEETYTDPTDWTRQTPMAKAIANIKQEFEQLSSAYDMLDLFGKEIKGNPKLYATATDKDRLLATTLEAQLREKWAQELVAQVKGVAETDPMTAINMVKKYMQSFEAEPTAAQGLKVLKTELDALNDSRDKLVAKMKEDTRGDGLKGLLKELFDIAGNRDEFAKKTGDTEGANAYYQAAASRAMTAAVAAIGAPAGMSEDQIDSAVERLGEIAQAVAKYPALEALVADQVEGIWVALAARKQELDAKTAAEELADLQARVAANLEALGQIDDANRLALEAEVSNKRKAGWTEVELEEYKASRIAEIQKGQAEAYYKLQLRLGKVSIADQVKHELEAVDATEGGLEQRYEAIGAFYDWVQGQAQGASDAEIKAYKMALNGALDSYAKRGQAAKDMVDAIKTALGWLDDPENYGDTGAGAEGATDDPKTWGQYLGEQLQSAFSSFAGLMDSAKQGADMTKEGLEALVTASPEVAGAVAALGGVAVAVGAIFAVLIMLIASSRQFKALGDLIAPLFQQMADAVGSILEPIMPIIVSIFKWIANIFKSAQGFFKWIGSAVAWLWNGIADALNWLFGWIPGFHVDRTDENNETNQQVSNALEESKGADTQISEITGPSRDLLIETLRPLVALDNLSTYFRSVETAIIEMKEAFLAYVGQAIGGERAIAAAGNTWYIDTVNVNLSAEGESGKGAMDNLLNLLATQAKNVLLGSGAK